MTDESNVVDIRSRSAAVDPKLGSYDEGVKQATLYLIDAYNESKRNTFALILRKVMGHVKRNEYLSPRDKEKEVEKAVELVSIVASSMKGAIIGEYDHGTIGKALFTDLLNTLDECAKKEIELIVNEVLT